MALPLQSRALRRSRTGGGRTAGFTLIEMIVTLGIFSIVLLGILAMFDMNGRIARIEGRVSELQQSLRAAQQDMVRIVHMAARGGLPVALFPDATTGFAGRQLPAGLAIEIANNVAVDTRVAKSADA